MDMRFLVCTMNSNCNNSLWPAYVLPPCPSPVYLSCQVLHWDKASDGAKAEAVTAFQTLHTEYLASVAKITAAPGTGPTETGDDYYYASTTALVTGGTRFFPFRLRVTMHSKIILKEGRVARPSLRCVCSQ